MLVVIVYLTVQHIAMLVVTEWIWLYNIDMLDVDLTVQYCYVGCYGGFDCTILLCWLLYGGFDYVVQYCYVGCYSTIMLWIWFDCTYMFAMLLHHCYVDIVSNMAMLYRLCNIVLVVMVDLTVPILLCCCTILL